MKIILLIQALHFKGVLAQGAGTSQGRPTEQAQIPQHVAQACGRASRC